MTQTTTTDSVSRIRRFMIDMAAVAAFNVLCAVVVTYIMRVGSSFFDNLVFSMCIGLLAETFIDGGRLVTWGTGAPPRIPFFALIAVSAPAAYVLGMIAGAHILGIPVGNVLHTTAQHVNGTLILTVLGCAFATWLFWNQGKLAELKAQAEAEKARSAAIEKQAMQAQLQLLQAQIEPHMLFNTLANLQGLIAMDAQRAQHMLQQLIEYLRATLSSSRAERTTVENEFSLLSAYLGLMSVRMGHRLSYNVQLPESLRDIMIPPMLLQPLVENAIKHGLEPKVEGGHIDVTAIEGKGLLTLTVADTGLGFDSSDSDGSDKSRAHIGLANVRERLHALYGERASVLLTPNTPSGVVARLTIPVTSSQHSL